MIERFTSKRLVVGLFAAVLVLAIGPITSAQSPVLRLDIEDTVAVSTQEQVTVAVYLDNYLDEIAGFQIWVQLDRPDLLRFPTDYLHTRYDTICWVCTAWDGFTCIDSVIEPWFPQDPMCDWIRVDTIDVFASTIDTTGSLVGGWDVIATRSLSGIGTDLLTTAIANVGGPPITPGISPQIGGVLLSLILETQGGLLGPAADNVTRLMINTSMIDHFGFSDPTGTLIGMNYECDTLIDSTLFRCDSWVGDQCLNWTVVDQPPFDSVWVDTTYYPCVDTSQVLVYDGSITLVLCGDVNGDGQINVSDLTALVGWMFPPPGIEDPIYRQAADLDASGLPPNISDVTYLVAYLFGGGPAPFCN